VLAAYGLERLPDRRMRERRVRPVVVQAEAHIETLGKLLTLEEVSDGQMVWQTGPDKLHGLDKDAD